MVHGDDSAKTDAEFFEKHGRHSSIAYSMSPEDGAVLIAAADVIRNKVISEMIKHHDCASDKPEHEGGWCTMFDPEMMKNLMETECAVRALGRAASNPEPQRGLITDDIPDYVLSAINAALSDKLGDDAHAFVVRGGD